METVENLNYLKTDYEDYRKRRTQLNNNNKAIKFLKGLKNSSHDSLENPEVNYFYNDPVLSTVMKRLTQNLTGK